MSSKKSVNEINQQIKQFCAELGIAGQSVEDELNDLPNQINPIYDEIVKRAKKLENEVNFYTNYAAYFLERWNEIYYQSNQSSSIIKRILY